MAAVRAWVIALLFADVASAQFAWIPGPGTNGAPGIQGEPGPQGPIGPAGGLNLAACTMRTASAATTRLLQTAVANVSAPAGFRILSGGGTCETGIMPANGLLNPTTWQVKCVGGRATATALVCPG